MEENMIEYIGTNAGLVWNALDKLGKMDVKQLKKATKIRTEKDVYAALACQRGEAHLRLRRQHATSRTAIVSPRQVD